MKKAIFLLGFLTVAYVSFAQEDDGSVTRKSGEIQTLMGKNNTVGGYGAISLRYMELENRDAFVFGARGGMVLGHAMALGLAGAGFINDAQHLAPGKDISLAGGYGGFFFEPIILPKYPVHISFPILIGAGGVSLMDVKDENDFDNDYKSEASDAFMVIEPGVEIELNVTRYFRFCLGAYYRYTSDVDLNEVTYTLDNVEHTYKVDQDILKGFSGGVTFKFGKF